MKNFQFKTMCSLILPIMTGIVIGLFFIIFWGKDNIGQNKKSIQKDLNNTISVQVNSAINSKLNYTMERTIFMLSQLTDEERNKIFEQIKEEHPDWK